MRSPLRPTFYLCLFTLSLFMGLACSEPPASTTPTSSEPETESTAPAAPAPPPSQNPAPPPAGETTAAAPAEEHPSTAVTPELISALRAIAHEPVAVPDQFYYRSNELRHDILSPHLADLGGVIMGVGSDQLYSLAAMAGSELIIGVDYDPRIRLVHRIYEALVPSAETIDDLIQAFSNPARDTSRARIQAALQESPEDAAEALAIFTSRQREMHEYLLRIRARSYEGNPGSWLAHPPWYAHIRRLFMEGRVLAFAADLTGSPTIQRISETLTEAGKTVRIFYMSNAEQFFPITTGSFRDNVRALPLDDQSLIVRTVRHDRLENAEAGRWHYMLHHGRDMIDVIEARRAVHTRELVNLLARDRSYQISPGISRMPAPDAATAPPRE